MSVSTGISYAKLSLISDPSNARLSMEYTLRGGTEHFMSEILFEPLIHLAVEAS